MKLNEIINYILKIIGPINIYIKLIKSEFDSLHLESKISVYILKFYVKSLQKLSN